MEALARTFPPNVDSEAEFQDLQTRSQIRDSSPASSRNTSKGAWVKETYETRQKIWNALRHRYVVQAGPLKSWKQAACEPELHPELPTWIPDALTPLDQYCSAVGPKAPEEKILSQDPESASLAVLICREAESMISGALARARQTWWKQCDEAVIAPIRRQSPR